MPISALALLVLLASSHQVASLSYDGSECGGYVEFALSKSADVISLDGDVAMALSSFPVYITYTCKAALRRYYCIDTYTPKANYTTYMCASVCQEVLDSCGVLLEEAAAESSFGLYLYDLFKGCAEDQPQTSCTNGSTGAYFSQDEPQCFYQTVVADGHGASFPLDPSACAIPCPGNVYHFIYPFWHKLLLVLSVLSVIGSCMTTFSFAKKYWRQAIDRSNQRSSISALRDASVFPVLMFCVGGFIQSLVNCIALIVELSQPKCEGNARWNSANSMCFVQSVTIFGACFWSSCWSFVMAFETWAMVFLAPNPLKRQLVRRWYAPVAVATTCISLLVMHLKSKQMLLLELPFCAASSIAPTSIEPVVDAVFWVPATVLVSLSSVMMFAVIFRVRRLDRRAERATIVDQADPVAKTCSCFESLLTWASKAHLLRIFMLVLCYNCFVLFISSLLYDEQLHASKYESNAADYYTCLFTYSFSDPELGREKCGGIVEWHVAQPLWTFTAYVIIVGGFGLIPFLVFGADYECRGLVYCIQIHQSSVSGRSNSKRAPDKPDSSQRGHPPSPLNRLVSMPLRHPRHGHSSSNPETANRSSNDSPGVLSAQDTLTKPVAIQALNAKGSPS